MTGNEIRKRFLEFFAARGHEVVESSPLVPHDDPTLLFTNAGMVQFKRVFMGEDERPYRRATTAQRCVRAGGKHNDLENVGYTARHHTFFEMLGNFSFGDYFKREAIQYAWEFLTKELGLAPERLWVSVFEDDDEAFGLWEEIDDLPPGRIIRLGEKDNFWAMGDTGPCGPCSEILIDQGPGVGCGRPDCRAGCDCDRYLELWNLVFMQFYRDADGTLTPLPKPSIDTGMGLERIAAVVQGVYSNYDSDLFRPIIDAIAALAGCAYGQDAAKDTALRVIADHGRAATFLVADGVLPANEGRGYVLRRLLRRAIRYGRVLGLGEPFLARVAAKVIDQMAGSYPHLRGHADLLAKVLTHEEERFFVTIDNGLEMLRREIERLRQAGESLIPGDFMFRLYDTYGFPVDIMRDVALEAGMAIDEAGYNAAMREQRRKSRQSWKAGGLDARAEGIQHVLARREPSRFLGYEAAVCRSTISDLLNEEGQEIAEAGEGERVLVVCPETVFYAEAGGQVGDQGEIVGRNGWLRVVDTVRLEDRVVLHKAEVAGGRVARGDEVELRVADGRRQKIAANHTATHLLHAALREILGEHVKQAGSLVEAGRLRFDFTHFNPLTPEEIVEVEDWVNRLIRANEPTTVAVLDRREALAAGATALFGEKYGDTVRMVAIGDVSKELCGGTHVPATGSIGLFKIVAETGVAAGVRRIEAVTGQEAVAYFRRQEAELAAVAARLKTSPEGLADKVGRLVERVRALEAEVGRLAARLSLADLDRAIAQAPVIDGVRVIAAEVALDSAKTLREIGDRVREKMGSAVAVLGGVHDGKAMLLALVSKDLTSRLHAGAIVRQTAALVGGKGGGRPDMAQAGGPAAAKLADALAAVPGIVERQLAGA